MGGAASPYDLGVLNRRITSLIAAVAVAGLAATGCSEQSAAVSVDGTTISRSDFEDELDLFYEDDELRTFVFGQVDRAQLRGDMAGGYAQQYVGAVAGLHVQFLVAETVLDDEGIELTDDDRSAAEDLVEQAVPGGLDALPDDLRDGFLDGVAAVTRLQDELGEEGFNEAMSAGFEEADVEINSRYGTWDADQFTVAPPGGPAPAPGAADPGAPDPATDPAVR